MNYPLYLARKLSLTSGKGRRVPAVTVAIISTALSIAVMLASVAIVLGFKKEIRDKVVGFNGHITMYRMPVSENDNNLITQDSELEDFLGSFDFITDYSLQASLPAILKTSEDFKGVYLKGLNGKTSTDFIEKNLEEGALPDFSIEDNSEKVLLSRIVADKLKLNTGDKIDTYFISDDIRVRRLEIYGIFNTHFDQYDDVLIFGSPHLVAKMGGISENQGTYLIINTDDFDKMPEYYQILQDKVFNSYNDGTIQDFYRLDNVLNQGRGFFSWLSLLDTNVIVILTLMMIVGSVTLVSGMLIIILQRKRFIGLMRALGANKNKIRQIFVFMALKIAIWGLVTGNAITLVFLYFQQKYPFLKLDAESYYIDFVPVFLPAYVVIALNLGVLAVTYLVLVLPARFVGTISPAETIEKE